MEIKFITVIKRKLKSLKHLIRYRLFLSHIIYLLSRIGITIIASHWIKEELDDTLSIKLNDDSNDYSFETLGFDDMKVIHQRRGGNYSEELFIERLQDGKICLGAKCKGEIAAFTWIELGRCSDITYTVELQNNAAYLFDMYTFKEFRGRNLAPYLRVECYKYLNNIGYNTFYSLGDFSNTPSVKFKKKLNAKLSKFILYVKLFNKFSWTRVLKNYEDKVIL